MQALSGLHVIELTDGVAGAFCGRLLADYGADVLKLEWPGGDSLRREPPLRGGDSLFYHYLNANKRLTERAPDAGTLLGRLERELPGKHILLTDENRLREAGTPTADLLARHPELTAVSVSWWGAQGPLAGKPGSDLGVHAAGGWMYAVGEPDREPLQAAVSCGQHVAGLYAAIAALWLARFRGSRYADVSIQESVATTAIYDSIALSYYGILRSRIGFRFATSQALLFTAPTSDGYIGVHVVTPQQWRSFCTLIGRPELFNDPRFKDHLARAENVQQLDEILLPWLARQKRLELFHAAQRMRVPLSLIPSLEEVLASPQLAARDYWQTYALPGGGSFRAPGAPIRLSRGGFSLRTPVTEAAP